jgi:hypothetical protein
MAISHEDVVTIVKDIDSPANGIAMEMNYEEYFDDFRLCLVPTEVRLRHLEFPLIHRNWRINLQQENVYKVKSYRKWNRGPAGIAPLDEVIFKDHTTENIALPNPTFMRLRAALCGVLHVSGAGKDIENIVRDLETDSNGNGPPKRIFSSGPQFFRHMEFRENLRAMQGIFNSRLVHLH